MLFFDFDTFWLAATIIGIISASTLAGIAIGRRLRERPGSSSEPIGVVQGALLGLVGLLLAFGLTMAVNRYETRRAVLVHEANTITTTHLRAQLLPEPMRSTSLELLERYGDTAIDLADQVPFTERFETDLAEFATLQRSLWSEAGRAVAADPTGTGPLTYVTTLNEMIDAHAERMASLRNRVPMPVMLLQLGGAAIAIGVLAAYLALLGRSEATALIAAAFVVVILFVSFDLDRPQRGFISVPFNALVEARAAMDLPPAADP